MNAVNLIPAARLAATAREQRALAWAFVGVIYLAGLTVLCLAVTASSGEMRHTTDAVRRAELRLEKLDQEVTRAKSTLKATQARLDSARSVGRHPDWSRVLAAFASLKGERVVLTSCEMSSIGVAPDTDPKADNSRTPAAATKGRGPAPRSFSLRLAGMADEAKDASAFVAALEATEVFDEVLLQEAKAVRFNDRDVIAFRVGASLRERGENKR